MVSQRDKDFMRRLGEDMKVTETNNRGTPEMRAATIKALNEMRAKAGIPPLDSRSPEEGFYERARALGMARIDRRGS